MTAVLSSSKSTSSHFAICIVDHPVSSPGLHHHGHASADDLAVIIGRLRTANTVHTKVISLMLWTCNALSSLSDPDPTSLLTSPLSCFIALIMLLICVRSVQHLFSDLPCMNRCTVASSHTVLLLLGLKRSVAVGRLANVL